MIVPVAAAGASDIVARILADAMTPLLGRQIVAENIAANANKNANAGASTRDPNPTPSKCFPPLFCFYSEN